MPDRDFVSYDFWPAGSEADLMMRSTIRRQILGIAVGLIVLMVIVSALSTVMTRKAAHQLDELTSKYVEAYGHLARMQIRSLERSLEVRRMVDRQDAVDA